MTIHKGLHPRDDVDRLYMSKKKKKEGRGIASIEDIIVASIQWLEDYIQKRGGRLITATRNNADNIRTKKTTINRKQKWEEKQLYGRFKQLISDIPHKKT